MFGEGDSETRIKNFIVFDRESGGRDRAGGMPTVSFSTISGSGTSVFPRVNVNGMLSKWLILILTSFKAWWKYGTDTLLKKEVKSSGINNDCILREMRPIWVKIRRTAKDYENILKIAGLLVWATINFGGSGRRRGGRRRSANISYRITRTIAWKFFREWSVSRGMIYVTSVH